MPVLEVGECSARPRASVCDPEQLSACKQPREHGHLGRLQTRTSIVELCVPRTPVSVRVCVCLCVPMFTCTPPMLRVSVCHRQHSCEDRLLIFVTFAPAPLLGLTPILLFKLIPFIGKCMLIHNTVKIHFKINVF